MTKYDNDFKERISRHCAKRGGGLWSIAQRYKVDISQLRYWTECYKLHGTGCFDRNGKHWSLAEKRTILQYMSSNNLSKREVAAVYNLPSFSMIGTWEREAEMAEKPKKEVEPEDLAEAYRLAKM